VTSQLRRQEKEHFMQVQDLHGETVIKEENQEQFLNNDSDVVMVEDEEEAV
jgi:hypothetical protein